MQGITPAQHKELLKALKKFDELLPSFGKFIPEGQEAFIRDKAAELKNVYDHYHLLLRELENCIRTYENRHESLRKVMYPCVRKMYTKSRNK